MNNATRSRRILLRRVLAGLAACLVLLVVLLTAAFHSETVFRFAMATAAPLIPGELHYAKLDGTLAGPVRAAKVDYRIGETRIRADRLAFDISPWALLGGTVNLEFLHAESLAVTLPPPDGGAEEPAKTPREILDALALPVAIRVDELAVDGFELHARDTTPLRIDTLHAALDWNAAHIVVTTLHAEGPTFAADGDLRFGLRADEASRVNLAFRWHGETFPVAGSLQGEGNARRIGLVLQLAEPARATLDVRLADLLDDPGWEGTLKVASMRPAAFGSGFPDTPWSGEFRFDGNANDTLVTGSAAGGWPPATGIHAGIRARVNAERVHVESLDARIDAFDADVAASGELHYADELAYSASGSITRVTWAGRENLALRDIRFTADGDSQHANLELDAAAGGNEQGRIHTDARVAFAGMRINADIGGDDLAFAFDGTTLAINDAAAEISGVPADYSATLVAGVKLNALPLARISANASGDRDHVVTKLDALQWLDGEAKGDVAVAWQDGVVIDAHLDGSGFSLEKLDPRLAGRIGGVIAARADLSGAQPDVSLAIESLRGELAGSAIDGRGTIRLANGRLATTGFTAGAGEARLELDDANDGIAFRLDIPALAPFHPDLGGQLHAEGRLAGPLAAPTLVMAASGEATGWRAWQAAAFRVDANIRAGGARDSSLRIEGGNIDTPELDAARLVLDLAGRRDAHRIALDIEGAGRDGAGELELVAEGGLRDANWQGDFSVLRYAHPDAGEWHLDDAAARAVMTIGINEMHLPMHCLQGETGRVCAGPVHRTAAGWSAKASLRELPVGLVAAWMPPGLEYAGAVSGDLSLDANAEGISGNAAFALSAGNVQQPVGDGAETLLGWNTGTASVTFAGDRANAELAIALTDGGRITGSGRLDVPDDGPMTIDAGLEATIHNLQLVPSLVPELSRLRGRLTATLGISGPLDRPRIRGEAELRDGSARVLALGTDWNDVNVTASAEGGEVTLRGRATSGEGHIEIDLAGRDTYRGFTGKATLTGENFKAMQTPEVEVDISPQLNLALQGDALFIDGVVDVPMARIEPRDLSTAVQPSGDQVIVNATNGTEADGFKVHVAVTTRLGENVRIDALGLTARMSGELTVSQLPGSPATGNGRLVIAEGQYTAYGQELALTRGEIIYTGQPLANPGLDIRAERTPQPDIAVGVAVRGPLAQPETSVYSDPPMSETEALSYLLFGRSIEQATGEEAGEVSEAAIALGLGGQKLLGNVGRRLGVEEVRVEDVGDPERASIVLGKYLSPDLYVSYGIGLFEAVNSFRIRYRISSKWTLEATSGLKSSADFLYTIER